MEGLAPTGKLRVALVFAPEKIDLLRREGCPTASPRASPTDLADALGKKFNCRSNTCCFPNSGLGDRCDRERHRRCRLHAGRRGAQEAHRVRPDYALGESTYMVTGATGAKTVEDVDKAGMRVIGIAHTTTIRAAGRTLKHTSISPVTLGR